MDLDDKVVTLGQRYHSGAVLGAAGSAVFCDAMPAPAEPGVRAPHLWLNDQGSRVSVHDLVGPGFLLLTGPDPTGAWANAARAAEVRHYRVGADPVGVDLVDAEHQWSERYGLDGGAVLLRPDGFIAWRADNQPADPSAAVRNAVRSIVDQQAATQPSPR